MRKLTTRRAGLLGLVALVLGVPAPAALAGQPYQERAEVGSGFTVPAGFACSADAAPDGVQIELVQGPWTMRYFENGRYLASGTHVDRVTNVATGASVTIALHGSFAMSGDTIRASGKTAFVLFPGEAGPGDTSTGRLYLFTGTVNIRMDELGAYTDVAWTGEAVDVCSMVD